MKEKTCYYCGTKYPYEEECCPVCGQKETVPEEIDEIPADLKPTAQPSQTEEEPVAVPRRRRKRGKNLLATLICILLALAVIACALWILNSIGILSFRPAPTDDSSLDLPVETTETSDIPQITGIKAIPDSMRFSAAGQKNRLLISFIPEEVTSGDPAVKTSFVSADPAVASVSEEGEVTAVAEGETTITAHYNDFTAECTVICMFGEITPEAPEVTDAQSESEANKPEEEKPAEEKPEETKPDEAPSDVSLSKTDFTLFSAGEKAKISVQNAPSGAVIVWSSKNDSIAAVSEGVVTAVAPGNTTITATVGGKTLSCIVRCRFEAGTQPIVTQTADGTALSHEDVTLRRSDETFKIRLLNGETAVSGVAWSSTNSAVCTVDADGTVHAVGAGTAKIIASYNGSSYSCIVRCGF